MKQEQLQEIRGLFHIVEQTAEIAEDSTLTQSFKEGEGRCVSQFNKVLERLNDMDVVPENLFDPLDENATFTEISIACHHLAAFLSDGLTTTSTDLKVIMTNFLGKKLSANFGDEMKDASIDVLIRKSMPQFFTEQKLEDINQSFTVEDSGTLTLEANLGNIDIHTSETKVINVIVRRSAQLKVDKHALDVLKDFEVVFDQQEYSLNIDAKFKSSKRYWEKIAKRFDIHFEITVPRGYNVNLKTEKGDIAIVNIDGIVKANTLDGELQLEKITGTVIGHTSNGNIRLNDCKEDLYLRSTHGDITVDDYTGVVDIITDKGNLLCTNVIGHISGETTKGNITLTNCKGGADVKSSGGRIELENDGPVTAKTNGDSINTIFSGQLQHDSVIEATGGSISVHLIPEIDVKIDAISSNGKITTEIPVTSIVKGTVKVEELQGYINEGGPLLRLRCIGGDINLKRRNAEENT